MTTTPEQRTKLKAAAEAAAPGEWHTVAEGDRFDVNAIPISNAERWENDLVEIATVPVGFNEDFEREQQANAAFILAANPAAVLELLSTISALEARVASAEGALRLFLKYNDADTSDVSTMLAYADALRAARAHFQSQGGDHE